MNRVRIHHREHPALDRPQRGEAASEQDGRPEREGQAGVQQQRRGIEYNAEVQGHAAEEEQRGDGAVRATEAQLEVGVSCDQVQRVEERDQDQCTDGHHHKVGEEDEPARTDARTSVSPSAQSQRAPAAVPGAVSWCVTHP